MIYINSVKIKYSYNLIYFLLMNQQTTKVEWFKIACWAKQWFGASKLGNETIYLDLNSEKPIYTDFGLV